MDLLEKNVVNFLEKVKKDNKRLALVTVSGVNYKLLKKIVF